MFQLIQGPLGGRKNNRRQNSRIARLYEVNLYSNAVLALSLDMLMSSLLPPNSAEGLVSVIKIFFVPFIVINRPVP